MSCSNDSSCRTCDGRCCALFTYPLDSVVERYAQDKPGEDDLKLLEMLRPLAYEEVQERMERFGVEGHGADPNLEYYTCRHWDEETRLCTDYDNRPKMCRTYPYGNGCQHGCDYDVELEYLVAEEWITPKEWFRRAYK